MMPACMKAKMLNFECLICFRRMWPSASVSSLDIADDGRKWYQRIRWWRCADVLADCLLLSAMLYSGAMGQVEVESSIAAVQVLQGILAAMALNRALTSIHFSNLENK